MENYAIQKIRALVHQILIFEGKISDVSQMVRVLAGNGEAPLPEGRGAYGGQRTPSWWKAGKAGFQSDRTRKKAFLPSGNWPAGVMRLLIFPVAVMTPGSTELRARLGTIFHFCGDGGKLAGSNPMVYST